MKIILLEFIDEAEILLARHGRAFFLSKDTRVVCLEPKVRAYLKKEGIESEDTCGYLDNEAQHRIMLKCEELSELIVGELKIKDQFGFEKGYSETCRYIRFYINYLLMIVEIINSIAQKQDVSAFYVCVPSQPETMYQKSAWLNGEERLMGLLTRDFCRLKNIACVESYWEKTTRSNIQFRIVHKLAQLIARLDYKTLGLRISPRDQTVVVPGLSYRMDLLLEEIKKHHPSVKCFMVWEGIPAVKKDLYKIYLTFKNYLKKFKGENILESVIHLDLIKDLVKMNEAERKKIHAEFDRLLTKLKTDIYDRFVYQGIPLSGYVHKKIDAGLREEILNLQHMTIVLSSVFDRIHPKLLMCMYSAGIYHMMGDLANQRGIKALNISHGTHVPPNNQFERIENFQLATTVICNTYPYVAIQTPWAAKFLDFYQDSRQRLFTGPLLYSKIDQGQRAQLRGEIIGDNKNAKIIVHATTQKDRAGLRFHITETLDEYISTLSDIVEAVNKLKDCYLVVRPHPTCDITDEEFRILLPACERMKIRRADPFSKVLSAADMLISYSSTTIEEAIQNDIPVLLYDKWRRYNHFNLKEISNGSINEQQPAYYLARKEYLQGTIYNILFIPKNDFHLSQALLKYKYPAEFRLEFFKFVEDVLK